MLGTVLRGYGRGLRGTLGVSAAGLGALVGVVVLLCVAATGMAVAAILGMDLTAAAPEQLDLLREDFARSLVFLSLCAGVFLAATTAPSTAIRILVRTVGGTRWDRYVLTGAVRDLLCIAVPVVLCAVSYVPLASLLRTEVGFGPALLLGAGAAVTVALLAAGLVEWVRAGVLAVFRERSGAFATVLASVVVLGVGLALAPISLLPWDAVVEWSLFGPGGGVTTSGARGLTAVLAVTAVVRLGGYGISVMAERNAPVLEAPGGFAVAVVGGRGPWGTLVSFAAVSLLRVPVVLVLILLAWGAAAAALAADSELTAVVLLVVASGVAGSVGIRAHGAELPGRWTVLHVAESRVAVAAAVPVGSLMVCALAMLPTVAAATVLFEIRAALYFVVTGLTTLAFTVLAGTLVPVSSEEPLSTVGAGAVSFALSGGVVGLIESGLADRSESLAAVTAVLAALLAVAASALVALRRYRSSVLG